MPVGITTGSLDKAADECVNRGVAVLDALGTHDVGQGVVLQDGRVIAIEGAEGTDEMLRRIAALIDPAAPPAIFVKRRSRVRIHGLIFPLSEKRPCVSPLPVAYAFSHSRQEA